MIPHQTHFSMVCFSVQLTLLLYWTLTVLAFPAVVGNGLLCKVRHKGFQWFSSKLGTLICLMTNIFYESAYLFVLLHINSCCSPKINSTLKYCQKLNGINWTFVDYPQKPCLEAPSIKLVNLFLKWYKRSLFLTTVKPFEVVGITKSRFFLSTHFFQVV